jgi:hypothetical protein
MIGFNADTENVEDVMQQSSLCKFLSLAIVITILTLIIAITVFAQEKDVMQFPRGAQYFLGTTDELLIRVNIWGFVNKPGQYMVPSETDLISLLSYAGGPQPLAKLSKIRIVRRISNLNHEEIIELNVKKYIEEGKVNIPTLKPDDTIIVNASRWHYFNLSLEYISKVAMLAQVAGWYIYYSNNK